MNLHRDMILVFQLMIYSFFHCWVDIMHLLTWVASNSSTYVIPVLLTKTQVQTSVDHHS